MQPLASSTIFSTAERPVMTLPSIPTSPISFMTTATGLPWSPCSRTWRRSVVFPLPRKPVRMSTATFRTRASAERPPGEALGDGLAEQVEEGRRDVVDGHVRERATERRLGARRREHEDAVPVVVRLVGSGIVLEGVDAAGADGADRAPVEVPEVDDQVGRHAVHLPVEVLRAMGLRADVPPARVHDRLDAGDELRPDALVVDGIDRPRRLASL